MPALTVSIPQPESAGSRIWRYMTLEKLRSQLQRKALYLSHIELLPDLHEGTMPKAVQVRLRAQYEDVDPRALNAASYPALRNRKWFYVSCWSRREAESEAMWRLYGADDGQDCVAVQTSYERLINAFDFRNDHAGLVRYVDFEKFDGEGWDDWKLLFLKRIEFESEQEIRIVKRYIKLAPEDLHTPPNTETPFLTTRWWEGLYDQPKGVWHKIDLPVVLSSVVVSPYASNLFFAEVETIVRELAPNIEVQRSSMNNPPILE